MAIGLYEEVEEEPQGLIKTWWQKYVKLYQDYKKAYEEDKRSAEIAKEKGLAVTEPNRRVLEVLKANWATIVIAALAVFMIWQYVQPRKSGSHHGYNSRGERY